MSEFKLVLVDHYHDWSNLRPITSTRTVAEIRIGILTIKEKWEKLANTNVQVKPVVGYLQSKSTFNLLQEKTCFVNSSVLPTHELLSAISKLKEGESLYKNRVLLASMVNPAVQSFEKELEYEGEIYKINYCWDIFKHISKVGLPMCFSFRSISELFTIPLFFPRLRLYQPVRFLNLTYEVLRWCNNFCSVFYLNVK